MKSLEFKHFLKFIEKTYPDQMTHPGDAWASFVQNLDCRKSFVDYAEGAEFHQKSLLSYSSNMPILSTGGYNDTFLKFIANTFGTRIVKCREYMTFVTTAIDYLNKWTNDCFFTLDRQSENIINYSGRLKAEKQPIQ